MSDAYIMGQIAALEEIKAALTPSDILTGVSINARLRELAAELHANQSCGQPSATVSEGGEERVSAATSSPHDLVEISVEAIRDCIRANDMREAAYVRAVLTAIEKAGHRIVPVEITEEMRLAGFAADFDGQPLIHPIWSAMLAAAPKVTP